MVVKERSPECGWLWGCAFISISCRVTDGRPFSQVTKSKRWGELGRVLGYTGIPGLSAQLKNAYTRIILPYENFYNHVRNSPSLSPGTPRNNQAQASQSTPSAGRMGRQTVGMNGTGPSRLSSPLSEIPDDNEDNVRGPENDDDSKWIQHIRRQFKR